MSRWPQGMEMLHNPTIFSPHAHSLTKAENASDSSISAHAFNRVASLDRLSDPHAWRMHTGQAPRHNFADGGLQMICMDSLRSSICASVSEGCHSHKLPRPGEGEGDPCPGDGETAGIK